MRNNVNGSYNIVWSLSFIIIQLLLRSTNSFTIINNNQFKTQTSFNKHYATIEQSSINVDISPSVAKSKRKSKTDELNLELSKLYHETIETGNISQVYEMEHIIFSYNSNSTLENASENENDSSILDTISYNTLLSTWKNMAVRYEEGTVVGSIPEDILPKNHVYVSKDIAIRATRILNYMEDKNLVDVTSYNIVIDTWAKCKSNDGVHEVDKLLKRMLESDDDRVTPDVVTFNAILDTCSNIHSNVNTIATNVEQKVEDMYGIMQSLQIKPNVRTYNLLISSYSKSIANHLEIGRVSGRQNNNNNGVLVNKEQYQTEQSKQQQQKRIYANNAIETKELQRAASKRVLELINEVRDDDTIDVTAGLYSAAIDCLARCCLPHQCEMLLNELETLFIDEQIKFNQKSKGTELFPQHVLALSPNIRSYTSIINAWSWSKKSDESAYKALAILDKVEKLYDEASQNKQFDDNYCNGIKPNVRTYTAVISCISHSRIQEKAVLSLNVFKRLVTKYAKSNKDIAFKPNIFTYNAVIDTCSKVFASNAKNPQTDGAKMQADALKIAFDVFKLIRKDKSVKANYVTYGTLLKATKNLLPIGEERSNIIKVLFGRCCKEGHVDETVLKQLRQTVSIDEYKNLLGKDSFDSFGSVHFEKLPKSWSANIGK